MITVLGKLTAIPGKESLLQECAITLAEETRVKEPGCVKYIPYLSTENLSTIYFFAQYIDQDAYQVHAQSPHFKEALEKIADLVEEKENEILDGEVIVQFLHVLI